MLCRLPHLEELTFTNNRVTVGPDDLGQLRRLETLWLSRTCLTNLGPVLGQLTEVRHLHLENLGLDILPEELFKLGELTTLYLSDNRLETLEPSSNWRSSRHSSSMAIGSARCRRTWTG